MKTFLRGHAKTSEYLSLVCHAIMDLAGNNNHLYNSDLKENHPLFCGQNIRMRGESQEINLHDSIL